MVLFIIDLNDKLFLPTGIAIIVIVIFYWIQICNSAQSAELYSIEYYTPYQILHKPPACQNIVMLRKVFLMEH